VLQISFDDVVVHLARGRNNLDGAVWALDMDLSKGAACSWSKVPTEALESALRAFALDDDIDGFFNSDIARCCRCGRTLLKEGLSVGFRILPDFF
jgi:hypothetical protein